MVFLLGINFPERTRLVKALTSLYGISANSATRAPKPLPTYKYTQPESPGSPATPKPSPARHNLLNRLLAQHYIHPTAKLGQLSDATITALTASLSQLTIENDLRRRLQDNIRRLRDMGAYRGRRHAMGLPVRGQRTRTQNSTAVKLNKVERRG